MRRLFRDVQRVPETSRRLTRPFFASAARARVWLMAAAIVLAPMMVLASQQRVPTLRTETTTLRSYDGREMPAEVLRITVPERRAHPGRTVIVGALRLRSSATNPGHPIVFLMGGPGIPGTVMAPIPAYFTLFQRLRAVADVILVDQRGLRSSEPVLDCPFTAKLPVDAFVTSDRLVAAIRAQVATCAEHWRRRAPSPRPTTPLRVPTTSMICDRALGSTKLICSPSATVPGSRWPSISATALTWGGLFSKASTAQGSW